MSCHSSNFKQFFFKQSIEIILRIHKLFNTSLKFRGHLIKISIRVVVGISIIIRGITRIRPRIKISSIRIVTKIVPCDAPRPMHQVSSSYSLSLPCHLLACCILSCHHVHRIIMFSKLASVRVPPVPCVVRSEPTTLARARGMSDILFYKWLENVLGMG